MSPEIFPALSLPQDYLNVRGHVRANVMQVKGPGGLAATVIVMMTDQIHKGKVNLVGKRVLMTSVCEPISEDFNLVYAPLVLLEQLNNPLG